MMSVSVGLARNEVTRMEVNTHIFLLFFLFKNLFFN